MLAERGAIHVFQPDASICGGILACLETVAIAQAYDLEVVPHVGGPTAIGLAANIQWAAAADVRLMEWDIDPSQPLVDLVAPSLALGAIVDGVVRVPDGPGLGIEVDEAVLDAHPYVPGETYAEVFPEHETGRLG